MATTKEIMQERWDHAYERALREAVDDWRARMFDAIDTDILLNAAAFTDWNIEIIDEADGDEAEWPMWSTLWRPDPWIAEQREELLEAGFTLIDYDGDLYIGVNGAGYSFFEHHWKPLYQALGYTWHERYIPKFVDEEKQRIVRKLQH